MLQELNNQVFYFETPYIFYAIGIVALSVVYYFLKGIVGNDANTEDFAVSK